MSRVGEKGGQSPVKGPSAPQTGSARDISTIILGTIIVLLVISNVLTYLTLQGGARTADPSGDRVTLKDFKVVNAHDHLFARRHLDKYLEAAKKTGVVRTLFVGSSEYTLMGAGYDQAKGNEENNQVILKVAKELPGKIIPLCTIHPDDEDKVERIKRYVAGGSRGLKLYTGHGNFYDRPLDAEEMLPVYAYCQETGLPICWHINLNRYFADFLRVMKRFPRLTVIIPHFGVTFFRPTGKEFAYFQKLLDTYPTLYTDTSFGTRAILVSGLEAVSRHPEVFRAFFEKYSDRILFGTDMVVTGNKEKTPQWVEAVLRACRDVLEKESFHFFMGAVGSPYAEQGANNIYGAYRGLALDDAILRKVYETNVEKLFPSR